MLSALPVLAPLIFTVHLCICVCVCVYTIIIPILAKKTLRFRDLREFAPGHRTDKWQIWDLDSGLSDSEPRDHWI